MSIPIIATWAEHSSILARSVSQSLKDMLLPLFLVALWDCSIACAVVPVLLLFSFNAGYPFFLHLECVFDLGSLTHPYGVTGLLISSQ